MWGESRGRFEAHPSAKDWPDQVASDAPDAHCSQACRAPPPTPKMLDLFIPSSSSIAGHKRAAFILTAAAVVWLVATSLAAPLMGAAAADANMCAPLISRGNSSIFSHTSSTDCYATRPPRLLFD